MADQLYLSCSLRGPTTPAILRSYQEMLRTFPYSRLSRGASTLRVQAVSPVEPALFEQSFEAPLDIENVIPVVSEYASPDCSMALETYWDLWQYEKEWKLSPARVSLMCFLPEFDSVREEDLRIDFGIDTHFLPQLDLPNYLFMARSNIRSLLQLVHQLDTTLQLQSRRLWTESGENFSDRLQLALAGEDPPVQ